MLAVAIWLASGGSLGVSAYADSAPDGGSAALIQALAPPPPPRVVRHAASLSGDGQDDGSPPLLLIVSGVLGVALCISLSWGMSERHRRARVTDELSRMKSYMRTVNRNPKMPGPTPPSAPPSE